MFDILFSNVTIITMDDDRPVIHEGHVGITGKHISYVGDDLPAASAQRTINATGKILMPGLVNAHGHTPMCLMRGYADDHSLQDWLLNYVFPLEATLSAGDIALGARLGYMESLGCGITSITDMYMFTPAMCQEAYDVGIKTNICCPLAFSGDGPHDFERTKAAVDTVGNLSRFANTEGRIIIDAGIHAEYTSLPEDWAPVLDLANKHGLNIHLHLSETRFEHEDCIRRNGKTPARLFYDAGVFDRPVTAAHCVWVTEEDMQLLSEMNVSVAHNPVSNLKLASGVAPVQQMLEKGINVALGSDGACSNNTLDLFEEIKYAALLQKGKTLDPTVVNAHQALKMATVNGAAAQGRQLEAGRIAQGFEADIILIDTDRPHMQPIFDPESAVAYCARGNDVTLTMVQGKILYENGNYLTIDRERVLDDIRRFCRNLK